MTRLLSSLIGALLALAVLVAPAARADRIKDIADIAGVRTNQLVGYGLVVGLNGSGDQTSQAPFTIQSIKNMLQQFGVTVPDNVNPQLRNVAAVMVTTELPPFAKQGEQIDVTVSSIGNAKSLRGGSLIMTPLRGADGQVYAVAQGNLIVGGLTASGQSGSKITVNIPSAGRIPSGATVERTVPTNFAGKKSLTLTLHSADFTTATRVAKVINDKFGQGTARPLDARSVRVIAPPKKGDRVFYISMLQNLDVKPAAPPARVIINSRTGTVVIGSKVRVAPAAVSHGSLQVTIAERPAVSQPGAFSDGQTAVVPRSGIQVKENGGHMFLFKPGVTLNAIVRAVNQVGAAPGDLVAILEALAKAGALRARLIVI